MGQLKQVIKIIESKKSVNYLTRKKDSKTSTRAREALWVK